MTLEERLNYCKICTKRKMDFQTGIVCSLTNEKPAFEDKCPDFNVDQAEVDRYAERDARLEETEDSSGYFTPEKKGLEKGVLGGIAMMVIAVVWFVVGWMAGRIFFYPPILFIIGLVGLIRGMAQGNVSGRK